MDEGWTADAADAIADVATRRWNSFARRHPKRFGLEDRVLDLARGLRERSPVDPIYVGPGDFSQLAVRLAAILKGDVDQETDSP
jgi:hypothetical protein